jgi:hypothetical protein
VCERECVCVWLPSLRAPAAMKLSFVAKACDRTHCYTFVTHLLHCCYTVATLLLHCWHIVVTLLAHCCNTFVTLLRHCCYAVVELVDICCYTVDTLLLRCNKAVSQTPARAYNTITGTLLYHSRYSL